MFISVLFANSDDEDVEVTFEIDEVNSNIQYHLKSYKNRNKWNTSAVAIKFIFCFKDQQLSGNY